VGYLSKKLIFMAGVSLHRGKCFAVFFIKYSPCMAVFERKDVSQFFALFLHIRGAGLAQAV
jgi:hypothetical protein